MGRAEADDAHFSPANVFFGMEKKVDFSCQTVGGGAKDTFPSSDDMKKHSLSVDDCEFEEGACVTSVGLARNEDNCDIGGEEAEETTSGGVVPDPPASPHKGISQIDGDGAGKFMVQHLLRLHLFLLLLNCFHPATVQNPTTTHRQQERERWK